MLSKTFTNKGLSRFEAGPVYLFHFRIYGYMHVRNQEVSNKLCPPLATMAVICPASTMVVQEVHERCMGVAIMLCMCGLV